MSLWVVEALPGPRIDEPTYEACGVSEDESVNGVEIDAYVISEWLHARDRYRTTMDALHEHYELGVRRKAAKK